jgi:hypothetical protein
MALNHPEMFQPVSSVPEIIKVRAFSIEIRDRFLFVSTYDELFFYCGHNSSRRRDNNGFGRDDDHCTR